MKTVRDFIFLGSKITSVGDYSHEIKKHCCLEEKLCKPTQHIKKHRHYFVSRGLSTQSYDFSISHVWTIKKADC